MAALEKNEEPDDTGPQCADKKGEGDSGKNEKKDDREFVEAGVDPCAPDALIREILLSRFYGGG